MHITLTIHLMPKAVLKTIVSVNVWGVGWEERGGGGERWEEEYKVTFDYDI